MKEVELVIKIPEKMYKWVNDANRDFDDYGTSDFIDLVKNGTLLPKRHGRLGDLDVLETEMSNGIKAGLMIEGYENYSNINDVDDCLECVKYAPTIIVKDDEQE